METETQKRIRMAEHDLTWTPPQSHVGPWIVDHSKSTGRVDVTPGRRTT